MPKISSQLNSVDTQGTQRPPDSLPSPVQTSDTVQIHLRLPRRDADVLRSLAAQRCQTLSACVRSLLRAVVRTSESGTRT